MFTFLYLFIGLVVGAAIAYLFAKNQLSKQINEQLTEMAVLKSKIELQQAELLEKKKLADEIKHKHDSLQIECITLQSSNQHLQEKLESRFREVEELQKKFANDFEVLANNILEKKSKAFTESNQKNIGDILNPLKEKIKDFEKKVEETYDKESKQRFVLENEIKRLAEMNQVMTKEASNLVKALKGDTKLQGNWGEGQLERTLELSGLQKDIHYKREVVLQNDANETFRPDVIVYMPDSKNLIIDSKVSLNAYVNYQSAEGELERAEFLKQHLESIRKHIKELGKKDYPRLNGINPPDYVFMYIPIEAALYAALQADSLITEEALKNNILLVSNTILLHNLRTIASIWRQENQNRNAQDIAKRGAELYDKFVGLTNDLLEVGAKMDAAKKAYAEAMGKISTGRGNLVGQVEKLKILGLKPGKNMPEKLLERALDEEQNES